MCTGRLRRWIRSICGKKNYLNNEEIENNNPATPLPKKIMSILFGMLVFHLFFDICTSNRMALRAIWEK